MIQWNASLIDAGPEGDGIAVPIYGAPVVVDGVSSPTVAGYEAGYHLNAAQQVADETPAALAYQVFPASPTCVWSSLPGQAPTPTIFFKFPDRATAEAVLAAYVLPDAA